MIVHLHRFADNEDRTLDRRMADISHRYVSASWSESIHPPWGMMQLTLMSALGDTGVVPEAGDWIVLREEGSSVARFLGRVTVPESSISIDSDATVDSATLTVSVEHWFNTLSRPEVHFDYSRSEPIGTLLDAGAFARLHEILAATMSQQNVGEVLRLFWEEGGWVAIPETLLSSLAMAGGIVKAESDDGSVEEISTLTMLASEVRVVSDEAVAKTIAPTRSYQEVVGPMVISIESAVSQMHTAADLIRGTFCPSPEMIELFPSFEPIPKGLPDSERTRLSEMLGVMPVIMYRMKPFRSEPFSKSIAGATVPSGIQIPTYKRINPLTGAVETFEAALVSPQDRTKTITPDTLALLDRPEFDRITWRKDVAGSGDDTLKIDATDILAWNARRSDDQRVNAVTTVIPYSPDPTLSMMEAAGLPVTNDEDIVRHGFRPMRISWPFLPAIDDPAIGDTFDYMKYLRTVAAQGFMWYSKNHFFESGTLTIPLNLKARHGSFLSITGLPVPSQPKKRRQVGDGARDRLTRYTAYIEAVQHSVATLGAGESEGTTTLTFIRGTMDDGLRNAAVKLKPIKRRSPKQEDTRFRKEGRISVYGERDLKFIQKDKFTYNPILVFPEDNKSVILVETTDFDTKDIERATGWRIVYRPAKSNQSTLTPAIAIGDPAISRSANVPYPTLTSAKADVRTDIGSVVLHYALGYTEETNRAEFERSSRASAEFSMWRTRYKNVIGLSGIDVFSITSSNLPGLLQGPVEDLLSNPEYGKYAKFLAESQFDDNGTLRTCADLGIRTLRRMLYPRSGDTHFCIRQDGHIFQYGDVAYAAVHSGNPLLNHRSISIDLVNRFRPEPKAINGKLADDDFSTLAHEEHERFAGSYSRERLSDWTLEGNPVREFVGPTTEQLGALWSLLAELRWQLEVAAADEKLGRFGVRPKAEPLATLIDPHNPAGQVSNVTPPNATSGGKDVWAWGRGLTGDAVTGVMHHAQVRRLNNSRVGREDALGVDIAQTCQNAGAIYSRGKL